MEMSPGSRPSHGTFPAELAASSRIPPRTIITSPKPRRIFPRSATAAPVRSAAAPGRPARRGRRGAMGDSSGALELDVGAQDGGRARDDRLELLQRVEVEVVEDAEALAERRGEHPRPRG